MAENKKHVFEEKLTKGEDIDEDILLESFKRNEHNSLKILLGLYKGQYFRLIMAVLLFKQIMHGDLPQIDFYNFIISYFPGKRKDFIMNIKAH